MILNDNIELNKYDTGQYVISTEAERYFIINEKSFHLINLLKSSNTWEEAFSIFQKDYDANIDADSFKNLVYDKFGSKGIIAGDKGTEKARRGLFLRLRQQVIPPDLAGHITSPFKFLFTFLPFHWLFISLLVFNLLFILFNVSYLSVIDMIPFQAWMFIALFATTVLHEFGHITACQATGAKHGGIGFGFYFIFPVNYAEVNGVWALNKKERVMVNLAGVFFEMMYASVFIILFMLFSSPLFFVLAILIFTNSMRQLYPFFRLDGYWVLSDLIGVPNLMYRSGRELKKYISTMISIGGNEKIEPFTRTGKSMFLAFYAVMNFLITFFFIGLIFFRFQNEVIDFPYKLTSLFKDLLAFKIPISDLTIGFFMVFVFYLLILRYAWRFIKSLIPFLGSKQS